MKKKDIILIATLSAIAIGLLIAILVSCNTYAENTDKLKEQTSQTTTTEPPDETTTSTTPQTTTTFETTTPATTTTPETTTPTTTTTPESTTVPETQASETQAPATEATTTPATTTTAPPTTAATTTTTKTQLSKPADAHGTLENGEYYKYVDGNRYLWHEGPLGVMWYENNGGGSVEIMAVEENGITVAGGWSTGS